ncbi:hypothetical protein FWD20_01650 [Candidatus Saccharibacteria bacterium]|nr:hypothetical protein [Candidatus Saccharibacteria bacterium]
MNDREITKKLVGNDYEKAKRLILDKGLSVSDDIFAAPVGTIDEQKSKIYEKPDGTFRFYCYMKHESIE